MALSKASREWLWSIDGVVVLGGCVAIALFGWYHCTHRGTPRPVTKSDSALRNIFLRLPNLDFNGNPEEYSLPQPLTVETVDWLTKNEGWSAGDIEILNGLSDRAFSLEPFDPDRDIAEGYVSGLQTILIDGDLGACRTFLRRVPKDIWHPVKKPPQGPAK